MVNPSSKEAKTVEVHSTSELGMSRIEPPRFTSGYEEGFAQNYDARRPFSPAFASALASAAGAGPGRSYLDCCAGTGLYSEAFVKAGGRVILADGDASFVDRAREKFKSAAEYHHSLVHELSLPTPVDAAGIVNGLHYLIRQEIAEQSFRNLRENILTPGSPLFVGFCSVDDMLAQPHVALFRPQMEQIAFSAAQSVERFLAQDVEKLGFQMDSRQCIPCEIEATTQWLKSFIEAKSTSTLKRIADDFGSQRWSERLAEIDAEIAEQYPTGTLRFNYSLTLVRLAVK